jgi:TPR repeat protein
VYANGQGVLQDYAEAVHLYRRAAEQGYANAQNNLGTMYANGHGVVKSDVLAHMWFNITSANGGEKAPANRDIAENQMTCDEIAEAQALARVCMSSGYQNCD